MDMQGSRPLGVTQQQAWEALNDPETLKRCLPGCDKFEATGEGQYTVTMAVKVGPVSAKFAGKMTISDLQPPNSYSITFEGQGGVAGFAKGKAQVSLAPEGEGGSATAMTYQVEALVGGKLAQIGARLIDGAARKLADDFFAAFVAKMEAGQS